jgi:hypothetical protein
MGFGVLVFVYLSLRAFSAKQSVGLMKGCLNAFARKRTDCFTLFAMTGFTDFLFCKEHYKATK